MSVGQRVISTQKRAKFEAALSDASGLENCGTNIRVNHPRDAFKAFAEDLRKSENANWLD